MRAWLKTLEQLKKKNVNKKGPHKITLLRTYTKRFGRKDIYYNVEELLMYHETNAKREDGPNTCNKTIY